MPELPEVETIVRILRKGNGTPPLLGQRIEKVTINWPRHIQTPSAASFRRRIRRREINRIHRRGKFLVITLDQDTLLIHLGMSGDLEMTTEESPPGPYDHTVFHLESGWELRFSDARKFGRVFLLENSDTVLGKLGPEPLDPDFTPQVLESLLNGRRRILKPLLLDQSFLAGLGNIYADEALHYARIHPLRRSSNLHRDEIHALWRGIQEALQQGLLHNGASIDWVYRGGEFQNHFHVYQRTGEPCMNCSTPIERIVIGQRGAHFCPSCQLEVVK